MLLPLRALLDPLPDQLDFAIAELSLTGIGRWHPHSLIAGCDTADDFARSRIASYDDVTPFGQIDVRAGLSIEAQGCFAIAWVRAMASKALIGQDGPDIAVEVNRDIGRAQ